MATNVTETCPWCGTTIARTRFLEIQERIRAEEQKRVAALEAETRKRLETTIRQQYDADYAKRLLAQREQADRQRQKEITDLRQSLEKDRDSQLNKNQAQWSREREAFQKKLRDLQRQVQKQTPTDLGDGAEIDVYETLRGAFRDDRIDRIEKGQPGGDILQEVIYKGQSCGRILLDAKNRQLWQKAFVSKLRADQIDAEAEHAILATTVFPEGKKELCIEDGIILVNPARVAHIVSLLRQAMIRMHVRGLSIKERATKMNRLYEFITSPTYMQRTREAEQLTDDILDVDVQEKKSHDNVWRKRGALLVRLNAVLREIGTEVSAIVEADESSTSAA